MSGININLKLAENLEKGLKQKMAIKVGILGDSSRGDGETNASIGAIHEYGSLSKGVPSRSFLRMPLETKASQLTSIIASSLFSEAIKSGNTDRAMNLLGAEAKGIVVDAFGTRGYGKWKPLSQETIRKKGSSAPLIDTRQLAKSITYEVVNGA